MPFIKATRTAQRISYHGDIMPIINIQIMQGHDDAKKTALLQNASQCVVDSIAAPLSSVRVVIDESPQKHVIVAGKLGHPMALARVFLIQGRTEEKKAALIAAMHEAIHSSIGISKNDIRVIVTDVPNTNMGMAGGVTAKSMGR